MSQKNVATAVGKLVTDEEFRGRFRESPREAVHELLENGLELTPCECQALCALDVTQCERFADALDPRLQKASLKGAPL